MKKIVSVEKIYKNDELMGLEVCYTENGKELRHCFAGPDWEDIVDGEEKFITKLRNDNSRNEINPKVVRKKKNYKLKKFKDVEL